MAHKAFAIALLFSSSPVASQAPVGGPVIDMHLHAGRIRATEPIAVCPNNQPILLPGVDPRAVGDGSNFFACDHPILSAATSAELRDRTIAAMHAHNVRRGVLAGPPELVDDWMRRAPGLFLPAAAPSSRDPDFIATLRHLHSAGSAALFAELGLQYLGRRADDPAFEPFWALAEKLEVPVGIHLGEGQPGQIDVAHDPYRAALTSPFQLETVLQKHPRLRLYVMHAASPLTDEMIAMLFEYPTLYVDVAANDWNMPRAQFYGQLKRLVDAGFSQRIMFGSDQTLFPQAIGLAIQTIDEAPFLTAEQKRDILYHNAARFLRLSKDEIAKDHAPAR